MSVKDRKRIQHHPVVSLSYETRQEGETKMRFYLSRSYRWPIAPPRQRIVALPSASMLFRHPPTSLQKKASVPIYARAQSDAFTAREIRHSKIS
jgi:hypothetical protein